MTASKNLENITVLQPLSCLYLPVWLKTPPIFTKMWTFHQVPDYSPVQNVLRALKILEMKDFKKSKTKTLKIRTTKTKTSKTKTSNIF